jgi:hypothetical protein
MHRLNFLPWDTCRGSKRTVVTGEQVLVVSIGYKVFTSGMVWAKKEVQQGVDDP